MRSVAIVVALGALLSGCAPARTDSGPTIYVDVRSVLSAFMAYGDERYTAMLDSAKVLARTDEVRSGDWDRMLPLLTAYKETGLASIVIFAQPDGRYASVGKGWQKQRAKDRNYFREFMAGKVARGDFIVSRSTGRKEVVIAVPVKRDGKIVGGLVAGLFLDDISRKVDDILGLPPDMYFFALAPDGTTILHRAASRGLLKPQEQGDPSMTRAVKKMLSTSSGEVTYRYKKVPRRVFYRKSPVTGWVYAVAMKPPPGD